MNIPFLMADSITPSTQTNEASAESTGRFKDFYNIIKDLSDSGEISIDESELDMTETKVFDSRLILPSMENVAMLSKGLDEQLDDLFRQNKIPKDPPIEMKYSYNENKVSVYGGRADAQEIEDLINSDPELKEYTRSFLAISSHAVAIQESLEFQEEYRRSNGAEEIIRKYSYLFNDDRKLPEVSYMFGTDSGLLADGQLVGGQDKTAEIIADMKHMLLMNYINETVEDEDEEGHRDDNGAEEKGESENTELKQLRLEIERTRERALFLHGTDKNKHVFGISETDESEQSEETDSEDKSEEQLINMKAEV